MMDYVTLLWLSDVLGGLEVLGIVGGVLFLITGGAALAISANCGIPEQERKPARRYGRIAVCAGIACLLLAVLLPSKRTVYAFIALKAGKELSETALAQEAREALSGILKKIKAQ